MNSEKVSIILPTYNGARFLRQSIDSCLQQTHSNIELVIVDDASTDETPQIIASYHNPKLISLRHSKNQNLPAALNTGFKQATGEYLTWTSDDNYYALDAIEKMLTFLKTNDCDFIYCDHYRFKENQPSHRYVMKEPDKLSLENLNGVGACFLYKKKVRDFIGEYDSNAFLAEDYDYWMRVAKRFRMCHFPEVLYFYREHNKSLSARRQIEIKICSILARIKNNYIDDKRGVKEFIKVLIHEIYCAPQTHMGKLFNFLEIITGNRFKISEMLVRMFFIAIQKIPEKQFKLLRLRKKSIQNVRDYLLKFVTQIKF